MPLNYQDLGYTKFFEKDIFRRQISDLPSLIWDQIREGVLNLGGSNNASGYLEDKDSINNEKVIIDNQGLKLYGGQLLYIDPTTGQKYIVTIPASEDTLIGKNTTDTLINKTLTNPVINYTDTGIGTDVRAKAFTGVAQSIPNATATKIVLATEDYDPGNNFDNVTNYRFVAPVTGYYLIVAQILWAGNTTGYRSTGIYVNGAAVCNVQALAISGSVSPAQVATDIRSLTLGDYVELYGYQNSGGALDTQNGANSVYLAIHLLSI